MDYKMNWMLDKIHQFGDKTVFICENQRCSYLDLYTKIRDWQEKISAIGLKPGEVVAVVGDFNPDSAALTISLLANNNIIVPLTNETQSKHGRFFDLANVEWCFEMDIKSQHWKHWKVEATSSHHSIEQLRTEQEAGLVLFTSGTTGESKGAVLKASSILQRFEHAKVDEKKALRCIVFLKLDHIGGLNTLFSIVFSGGTVISIKNRTPKIVCEAISEHQVELLPTTPTFLNMMLISGTMDNYDMSSLLITYGTEPMPVSTLIAVSETFPTVKLKQTYGLTELGIFSTRSKRSDSGWLEIGGEGVETRVVEGILEIKTQSCMLGYLNAPSPFTEDGFYITGDRVEVDGSYFRILGRDSEIINVGGEKVYPTEVESVLLEMPNVKEVLVTGKSSPIMGNIVCASFVLNNDESKQELVNRVHTFCKGKIESFKIPKIVLISKNSFMSARLKKARNKNTVEA
jgi:acyl-coenzyme A synthetase/AMP-(fatty) acid ligase